MDPYRVSILPEASSDLVRIFNYIEQDSPQNAASVIRMLVRAIDSLEQFPARYKVYRSNRDPSRIVRSMPVRPYLIYYRVLERENTVEVLTIRHGARRPPRSFGQ